MRYKDSPTRCAPNKSSAELINAIVANGEYPQARRSIESKTQAIAVESLKQYFVANGMRSLSDLKDLSIEPYSGCDRRCRSSIPLALRPSFTPLI